jgi:hypothetical protein
MGFGETILLKKGWEEGKGLGPNLGGMVDPIPVSVKLDRSDFCLYNAHDVFELAFRRICIGGGEEKLPLELAGAVLNQRKVSSNERMRGQFFPSKKSRTDWNGNPSSPCCRFNPLHKVMSLLGCFVITSCEFEQTDAAAKASGSRAAMPRQSAQLTEKRTIKIRNSIRSKFGIKLFSWIRNPNQW